MGEIIQGFYGVLTIIASLLFSTAYMIGGRSEPFLGVRARLWKRLIAPLLLASSAVLISILAHSFGWWLFASALWFIPIGYGGDRFFEKAIRRLTSSLFFTATALVFSLFTGQWVVALLQMAIGAVMAVILGTQNPLKAPQEEFLIAFSNTFLMGFTLLEISR
jgi:hypothetical protein